MHINYKFIIAFISTLALTACVKPTDSKPLKRINLTQSQIRIIQEGVRSQLKDPDSAKFGSFTAGIEDDKVTISVCGYVNAKNSFGGYIGLQRFIGVFIGDKIFRASGFGGSESMTYATNELCRRKGL